MAAGIDISGILRGLGAMRRRALAAAVRGVNLFGEHVIGDSQTLCPVETGALKASGTTLPAEVEGETVSKLIGHNVEYAAAVHERMELKHDRGQAKYLETAVRNNLPKFSEFVGNQVKKALS